jgi:hypothetical protein
MGWTLPAAAGVEERAHDLDVVPRPEWQCDLPRSSWRDGLIHASHLEEDLLVRDPVHDTEVNPVVLHPDGRRREVGASHAVAVARDGRDVRIRGCVGVSEEPLPRRAHLLHAYLERGDLGFQLLGRAGPRVDALHPRLDLLELSLRRI